MTDSNQEKPTPETQVTADLFKKTFDIFSKKLGETADINRENLNKQALKEKDLQLPPQK